MESSLLSGRGPQGSALCWLLMPVSHLIALNMSD